jgi:hypothetical protein
LLALEIAKGYIGQQEVPRLSNAGPFVEACLRLVGLGKGYAWCQAFVYRCYFEAANMKGEPVPCVKTAGVIDCYNRTVLARKILKKNATPKNILPGYQFIMDYGGGKGHTGIVCEVFADGSYTAIEGNTDENGSREGNAVCLRRRKLNDTLLRAFIIY